MNEHDRKILELTKGTSIEYRPPRNVWREQGYDTSGQEIIRVPEERPEEEKRWWER